MEATKEEEKKHHALDYIDVAIIEILQEGWFPFASDRTLTYSGVAEKVNEKIRSEEYKEGIKKQIDDFERYSATIGLGNIAVPHLEQAKAEIKKWDTQEITVTARMVQFRLKKMIEEGIIQGFYPQFNSAALGLDTSVIIQVIGPSGAKKDRDKLFEELAETPNMHSVYWTIGEASFFAAVDFINNYWLGFYIQSMKARLRSKDVLTPIKTLTSVAIAPPLQVHNTRPLLGTLIWRKRD